MPDSNTDFSRRKTLKLAGGAMVAGGLTMGVTGNGGSEDLIIGIGADDDFGPARAKADAVHRELNFGDRGKAIAGRFSEQAIEALRKNHDVRYVETDGTMHALHHRDGHDGGPPDDGGGGGGDSSECLPWGIDRVDAEQAASAGETGNGAKIAIVDTGIDDDHPDLNGKIDVSSSAAIETCKGRNCNYPWSDDNDHGTHCAGISAAIGGNKEGGQGVATEATLVAVKVLDKRGSGTFSGVADGIRHAADEGVDVISMSLGGGKSQAVEDAVEYAASKGSLLVASAGNSGPCEDCVGYPAAEPEVMAISSTNDNDGLSSFSSTGPEVDLAAPGSEIYSSVIGGYDRFSGTSMSCPHVSGAGALLMANGSSNTQARDTLTSSAEDIGLSSNESGSGLLDAAAAVGVDSSNDGFGDGTC